MRERAVTFGPDGSLVGILTEASPDRVFEDAPSVILLNSGIVHRVGANRLYVKLARRLADLGFSVLRFDHSGIGDSEPRRDDRPFERSAVDEARAAMDLMEQSRGADRFVLGGLCSGSDVAYWTALEDPRVTGLIQLDPFVYRTRRFFVRHYLPRLASPRAWTRSAIARIRELRRKLRRASRGEAMEADWAAPEYTRVFPPRADVARGLAELVRRDVSFYVFISGTMIERFNHPEQFVESFPEVSFGSRLTLDFAREADHTVTDLDHQERVFAGIERWSGRFMPDPDPEPAVSDPDPAGV